jgi:hypothetical protein
MHRDKFTLPIPLLALMFDHTDPKYAAYPVLESETFFFSLTFCKYTVVMLTRQNRR